MLLASEVSAAFPRHDSGGRKSLSVLLARLQASSKSGGPAGAFSAAASLSELSRTDQMPISSSGPSDGFATPAGSDFRRPPGDQREKRRVELACDRSTSVTAPATMASRNS